MSTQSLSLSEFNLKQKEKKVFLQFSNGEEFEVTCQQLRIHSPSAETRHQSQPMDEFAASKAQVNIIAVEPVGHYALKLKFDDGHESGLYSFETLYEIAKQA